MKEQKRVASINMTKAGFECMEALTKKTGLPRKEVVSRALVDAFNGTKNETIVKFKLPDPLHVVELRKDIVSIEAAADEIRKGLYSIRSRDPKQADKIAGILNDVKNLLISFESISETLKEKHRLLDGLSAADHARLPEALSWLARLKESAAGKADGPKRIAKYDVLERLVKLAV